MSKKITAVTLISAALLALLAAAGGLSAAAGSGAQPAPPATLAIAASFTGDNPPPAAPPAPRRTAARRYLTAPADLPSFTVDRREGDLAPGYLFVSMFNFNSAPASTLLILDNNGEPVYYNQDDAFRVDFKKLPDGYLTYVDMAGFDSAYTVMGTWYKKAREYRSAPDPLTGEAYKLDQHDIALLDDGSVLLLSDDPRPVDMSGLVPGGGKEVEVVGCVIQQITPAGEVVFQWNSWDHIPFTDTVLSLDRDPLRYIHCNSVGLDSDGHILLSSRNLGEITKIDRQSGAIIWRMGGKNNQFDFTNDRGFSFQHDARRLDNGHLTLFDNADDAFPNSRGVEYVVDETNKTAAIAAEFVEETAVNSQAMGNMQRLPNGNTLIGWGTSMDPLLTEFDSDGRKLLSLSSLDGLVTYRAFRFPWHGNPQWPPVLVARQEADAVYLHMSWNGATETAAYTIHAAPDGHNFTPVATVSRDGFETVYAYTLPGAGRWTVRVQPVSKSGAEGPFSNSVTLSDRRMTYLPLAVGQ